MSETEFSVVGKRLPRVDSVGKVTGEAEFIHDIKLPGMLYAKVLRSPHPHARILRVDASKAEKLPGVKAVITAEDTPKIKFTSPMPPDFRDKLPLEDKKVRFIGDEVAAVAAVDEETAEEAVNLIDVEYDVLPAVFDPEEAMKPDAPLVHEERKSNILLHLDWKMGDLEKRFREADHVFEDRFEVRSQPAHCALGPTACLVNPDVSGAITVWATTQAPHMLRKELAETLNLPLSKVRVIQTAQQGAYGGKSDMHPDSPVCALLALKTGKPVKLVYTREEEFLGARNRGPYIFHIKTGVKKDGTLTARHVKAILDKGAYLAYGALLAVYVGWINSMMYRVPATGYDAYVVYTNRPYASAFRGFGNPQIMFAIEQQMDMIAEKLGIDPAKLRIKNVNQKGDITSSGCQVLTCNLEECIRTAVKAIDWEEKKRSKKPNQGLGISSMTHCTGWRGLYAACDVSAAVVKVEHDGSATVYVGASETGQGSATVLTQIAAEQLGLPLGEVKIVMGDTEVTPADFGNYGDRTTAVCGHAVSIAALDAKNQLLTVASEMLDTRVEDLESKEGKIYVKTDPRRVVSVKEVASHGFWNKAMPITGKGFYDSKTTLLQDWDKFYPYPKTSLTGMATDLPGPSMDSTFGCQAVEVEVDPETGEVKVLEVVSVHDVGRAINPSMSESQVEGSIAQGTGLALVEQLLTKDGRILNPSFTDYKILNAVDMPSKIKIILVEKGDSAGPYGSKGIAEPAIVPTAAAIANAVYDAVGVRIKETPITPEKIVKALKEKRKDMP